MRPRRWSWTGRGGAAAVVALGLALGGCKGPKGSPGRTLSSFFSAVEDKDYEAMVGMVHPESIRVTGSAKNAERFLAEYYSQCHKYDYTVGEVVEAVDAKQATAPVTCQCLIYDQHHKEVPVNCSETFGLKKQDDGLWYVLLPQTQKVRSRM